MQGTAGVFSTVNTKEKDRILTDQGRATENDKLEQMQGTVAVVRGGGGGGHMRSYNSWQNFWLVFPASRGTGQTDQDRVTDSNT